jgi:hypothetical protein
MGAGVLIGVCLLITTPHRASPSWAVALNMPLYVFQNQCFRTKRLINAAGGVGWARRQAG